jgi:hypothetical protein
MTPFKSIYIILFAHISSLTICMESGEYSLEEKSILIQEAYHRNERTLNKYLRKCSYDPEKEIKIININLMYLREQIDEQYSTIYTNLRKTYKLDDTFQSIFYYIYEKSKLLNKDDIFKDPEQSICVTQENNIVNTEDSRLIDLLKKNLTANNIPTHLIDINYNNESFISAATPIISSSKENPWAITTKDNGSINIDKETFSGISPLAQEGLCISVINQLQHNINNTVCNNIIEIALKQNIDEQKFDDSVELLLIFSLFKIALQNAESAHALKSYYTEIVEENFPVQAYKTLCRIDRLYTLLDFFENKYNINNELL